MELPSTQITKEDTITFLVNIFNEDIIRDVCIYICTRNLTNCFYNFSDFFLKHRIDNDEVKDQIKQNIINLLKNKDYTVAYVFNKTGLVICRSDQEINKSVWKSNLDFTQL